MSGLIQAYNESLHLLSKTEERVIGYVLHNPEECLNLTVQELASILKVSVSTVIKAAKKLGYSGYAQLKLVVAGELNVLVQREKSSALIKDLQAYEELVLVSIREGYSHLGQEKLEAAAKELKRADEIDVYAFGFDAVAGYDLYLKMLQSGKRVRQLENGYEQIISAYNLDPSALVVAISSTGTSLDLLDALKFSKKSGASIVTVAPEGSRLCEYADINLESYYSRLVFPEGGLITRVVQLAIVDMLYMKFLEISGGEFDNKYARFREALDFKRRRKS